MTTAESGKKDSAMGMLNGRVALVTGGGQGLGRAIAERYIREGASVVIVDRDQESLEEASAYLGSKALAFGADASDVDALTAICGDIIESFGHLDILVNNAGGSAWTPDSFAEVTEAEFERVFSWNVKSAFFCTQACLGALRLSAVGSSVINLASIAGRAGSDLMSPQYSAAKAAVIGLTRSLAKHLGGDGIRVNAIAPGFIQSGPRVEARWKGRDAPKILEAIALGRRGESGEIADAAVYLGGEMATYVTGTVLDVNGGYLCL